jgi:23S rRNA pseudouridine2457 synthase
VISQFTDDGSGRPTLAGFGFPKGVYPIGRLDADSEGLLLLSDEAALNARLLRPESRHPRRYWAQVERVPTDDALRQLERGGVAIRNHRTLPCKAWRVEPEPDLPPRDPPIRFRKNVPTAWIALELIEGKNRQVRHMTAAVGHPTLRLIRVRIGHFPLGDLQVGHWKELARPDRELVLFRRVSAPRASGSRDGD